MRVNTANLYSGIYGGNCGVVLPFGAAASRNKIKSDYTDLRVFYHHIYEYKKGIRNLILTTEKVKYRSTIEQRLQHENIDYVIHEIDNNKINVYFGEKPCVDVVRTFNPKLNELTPEQDFMLGIMLGYDRVKQCERFMKLKNTI